MRVAQAPAAPRATSRETVMPKKYGEGGDAGHTFGPPDGGYYFTCTACGLVRYVLNRPAITCPERPLDEVFPGWAARYGRKSQDKIGAAPN